jgi:elongation factor Ts
MAEITAELVKTLRERTNAAMMDCKRALVAAGGDIEAAIEAMRKAGQAKADKKADRVAAEGIIAIAKSADNKKAVMADINCETDFVARSDDFKQFADAVAQAALANNVNDLDALANTKLANGETVDEARKNLIAKLGENIQIRRVTLVESDGVVGTYIHGSRIGVLAAINVANEDLAKDIAMHIAASNPLVIHPDHVPADLVQKEKDIFAAQAASSGKPADIIEKMIGGRIKKFLDEVSLMGQAFVKDPEQTVGQLLHKNQAQAVQFVRYGVGEGIEKKADNFVEEVMAQARGA